MTEYTPIFRSPIVMPEPATSASDLSVTDLTGIPITDVQGAVDTFMDNGPANPGDLMAIDAGLAARLPCAWSRLARSMMTSTPTLSLI